MSKSTTIRLGDWTATPELNLLERDGCSSKLEPRTMDLLVYLVNRAGEVVTTHEVMAQVWRGRVVEDSAVYKRINQLRKALGDDSRAPTFIETIPKRGYRLIAPVESGLPENPTVAKGQGAGSLKLAAGLLGIALVAIASIYYAMREDAAQSVDPPVARGAGRPDLPSIAALPLANIGPNEEHAAFFADGLHAELLTQLSKITSLRVIAATSVIEYAERQTSVSEVAQELGVSAVLKGTVQRVAQDLRVNVQLISHDNEQLWAERYDRRLTAKNLFDIQSEIATSIAAILHANVNAVELAQLQDLPTQSTQAYNFYLKGVGYALRPEVWANIPLARQQLELAVEKDPEFALAWAWLARVYVNMHRMQDILEPSDAWADMALAATRRALALDPDLPQAHIAMAAYHLNVSFDVQEALREATIAAAGMPGDSLPIVLRGQVHRRLQQWSGSGCSGARCRARPSKSRATGAP